MTASTAKPSVAPHPDVWIKIFIVLGLIAIVLSALMARALAKLVANEQQRLDACNAGQRTDCQPSPVWAFLQ